MPPTYPTHNYRRGRVRLTPKLRKPSPAFVPKTGFEFKCGVGSSSSFNALSLFSFLLSPPHSLFKTPRELGLDAVTR